MGLFDRLFKGNPKEAKPAKLEVLAPIDGHQLAIDGRDRKSVV